MQQRQAELSRLYGLATPARYSREQVRVACNVSRPQGVCVSNEAVSDESQCLHEAAVRSAH